MATGHWYQCARGHEDGPGSMFEGLQAFAKSGRPNCSICDDSSSYLFEFELGLKASGSACEVVAAYQPERLEYWAGSHGATVEFYPFLVILRTRDSSELSSWLPYWHVVRRKRGVETKYGQWAPIMQGDLFESLLKQARADGYLAR